VTRLRTTAGGLANVTNKQGQESSGVDVNVSHQNILAPTIHYPTFPPVHFVNSGAPALPPSFTSQWVFSECLHWANHDYGTFQSSSTSFGLSQADIENFSKF